MPLWVGTVLLNGSSNIYYKKKRCLGCKPCLSFRRGGFKQSVNRCPRAEPLSVILPASLVSHPELFLTQAPGGGDHVCPLASLVSPLLQKVTDEGRLSPSDCGTPVSLQLPPGQWTRGGGKPLGVWGVVWCAFSPFPPDASLPTLFPPERWASRF